MRPLDHLVVGLGNGAGPLDGAALELLDLLGAHRLDTLDLGAGKLRSISGIPAGSKEHHFETLQKWGLMELVGRENHGGGNPARVFELTDHGTEIVEEYLLDGDEAPDAYAAKIDRALDETGELRGRVEELERTVEQQADEIEALREERDEALDELRGDLEDALNGKYRTLLKEDSLDELDREQSR